MGNAQRDDNLVTVLLGVSSVDGVTPVTIYVDPTTHRLLVSLSGTSGNGITVTGTSIAIDTSVTVDKTTAQTLTNKTLTTPTIVNMRSWDGWNDANETWTYASATTITVPTGAASKYSKGDKIKLTQTTVKYFYIVAIADTVLTVTGGSDYSVANAAISANYYSKVENPQGFPTWMNWTPTYTWTGGAAPTGTPAGRIIKFYVRGNVCHINFFEQGYTAGTAVTGLDASLPVAALLGGDDRSMAFGTMIPIADVNADTYVYGGTNVLRITCASTAATGVRFMADYQF